jgi:hypothetical protein
MCARLDTTGLLADVTYAVLHGNVDAGRERCRLYRRAEGGYWLTCELDWTSPISRSLYTEAHLTVDWLVESLNIRSFGQEHRDASYYIEGLAWRATIQTDETTIERTVLGPEVVISPTGRDAGASDQASRAANADHGHAADQQPSLELCASAAVRSGRELVVTLWWTARWDHCGGERLPAFGIIG